MTVNPALRTFRIRTHVTTVVFVVAVVLGAWLLDPARASPGLAALLVLITAMPGSAYIWIILIYLHQQEDEYLRRLETRKCLIATGFTVTACTFYGFLHLYEVVPPATPILVGPLGARA